MLKEVTLFLIKNKEVNFVLEAKVTTIYIYIYFHSILNPISLSILGLIHHQFYPFIIV